MRTTTVEAERGDRSGVARATLFVLVGVVFVVFAISLDAGATDSSATRVLLAALNGELEAVDPVERIVVNDIRLPRSILGVMIGAALAISGAIMQGLFRNPLADPGIVGVSAGAGLGAVAFIVLGNGVLAPVASLLGIYDVPIAAFVGALVSTFSLYRISTRQGRTSVATMLLAGIAIAALANAVTGYLVFRADLQQLRDLTFWQLGSIAGATWLKVAAVAPILLPVFVLAPFLARGLNAMTLGEATAHHLGIRVQRFKRVAIVT
ncbi:MAG: iron chelate uptake ABC transporter family permease subunit, partial [Myxococcota bacterium]